MPVSSPSYFPPNSSTDQVRGINTGPLATGAPLFLAGQSAGKNSTAALIVIGHLAASGGVTNAITNLNGSIVIGNGSLPLWTEGSFAGISQPVTCIGTNNLLSTARVDSSVILGSLIYNTGGGAMDQSVLIGNNILQNVNPTGGGAVGMRQSVLIGQNIFSQAAVSNSTTLTSVIIGDHIFALSTPTVNSSVIIGQQIDVPGSVGTAMAGCVLIGNNISCNRNAPTGNILIGASVTYAGPVNNNPVNDNVVIGPGAQYDGQFNVVIGGAALAPTPPANTSFGNVIIGYKAGQSVPANTAGFNNLLLLEAAPNSASLAGALAYGFFSNGNLILGNSVQGTNRDFGGVPGTNMLKLLNGTAATGATIAGGGYFYVIGGVLHWVDSSGVDSQLSESVTGQLASSALVPYTNNAGAQAGTLLNGPTAGNPTKWIPINDNGTIRNIPAW